MKIYFDHNSQIFPVDLIPSGKSFRAAAGNTIIEIEILHAESGKLDLLLNGERVTAYVSSDGAIRWITINGQTTVLTKASSARKSGHSHHHAAGELAAPMPGQVRAVNVSAGDAVTKGQTLLVLEAMKMEIRIQSPSDGMVRKLLVKQGQTVEREQMLIEIEGT